MNQPGSVWMPPEGSTVAGEVDALFYFILYASIVLFVIIMAAMILFVLRYRRRGRVTTTSGADHNTTLEVIWTAIPVILILVVFVWGTQAYIRMSVVPANAMEVKVTGQKWFWSFDYDDGANSINELVVPVNKPVKLLMSSQDVIHSFFVPNFRIKKDVLPNRYTVTWFEATQEGEFDLFCTEYCGTGHSDMLGKVRVVKESEFAAWLEESSGLGEGMSLEAFGRNLYVKKACNTCHSVDGTTATGPSFLGVFGREESMADGTKITVDENYLRESILEPQARIVKGYQPVMPTYQGLLKDREVDALIEYLKSLKK